MLVYSCQMEFIFFGFFSCSYLPVCQKNSAFTKTFFQKLRKSVTTGNPRAPFQYSHPTPFFIASPLDSHPFFMKNTRDTLYYVFAYLNGGAGGSVKWLRRVCGLDQQWNRSRVHGLKRKLVHVACLFLESVPKHLTAVCVIKNTVRRHISIFFNGHRSGSGLFGGGKIFIPWLQTQCSRRRRQPRDRVDFKYIIIFPALENYFSVATEDAKSCE